MPHFRIPASFCKSIAFCCTALLSAALVFSAIACTGNGGAAYSEGTPSIPGGGGTSSNPDANTSGSGAGSGASGGSSGSFTAQELMDAITAGDADKVIELVSQDSATAGPETQTVSMSAEDLGLPAGGKVRLIISEINYDALAVAGADGFVRFEVPKIETNSWVTVELSVQDSGGTVLWYGSDTQQVKDGGNLSISLTRQYWTLTPGSIAVSATSYSLLYDPATWESDATMLSVTGLESAPAGSVFSYKWKDESGNVLGTDPTLTQSVYQLYGSPAGAGSIPPGDITKTITVTVSYTDASGAAVTADASADIALGGPVVLPTFSLHAAPPSNPADYDAAHSTPSAATPLFALTSRSAGIVITADAGAAEFPAGTQFTLTVNGTSFPSQASPVWTVSLADLGCTDATAPTLASPASLSIMCTAGNTRAQVPETGSGSASVCLLYTIPSFTISLTPPAYVAAKSDTTNKKYALTDLDGDFSFTPVPAAGTSFPAGTTFTWTVIAGSASPSTLTPDTGVGESCTKSLSDFGLTDASIGRTAAAATGISVSCTARNDHAESDRSADSPAAMSAFLLYTLPAFTISAAPTSYDANNTSTSGGVTTYALTSASTSIDLTATSSGAAFPAGTTFDWTVDTTSLTGTMQHDSTESINPNAMGITLSSSSATPTSIVITCKAKNANATADLDATDFTLKLFMLTIPSYKITLTAPTGIATETDASGDTVYLVTNSDLTSTSKKFTLKVEPESNTDSFPNGTKFSWQFDSATATTATAGDDQRDELIGTMCNITSAPSTASSYTIKCTASFDGLTTPSTPAQTTVKLKKLLGSKSAPDAVGDIVFNDGTASPYTDFDTEAMTPDQVAGAVAVIYDTSGMKGIGLQQGTHLAWATSGSDASTTCIATLAATKDSGSTPSNAVFSGAGATDGSESLTKLKNAVSDYSAGKYPGWAFVEGYATTAGLTGDYANGWYMPSIQELCTLYGVKDTVNAALSKISGAVQIAALSHGSSSQNSSIANQAWFIDFGDGRMSTGILNGVMFRAIRAFP